MIAHAIDLVASHIYLDVVSVGATINIMMAAAMAEGQTILENAAKEPHIVEWQTSLTVWEPILRVQEQTQSVSGA